MFYIKIKNFPMHHGWATILGTVFCILNLKTMINHDVY